MQHVKQDSAAPWSLKGTSRHLRRPNNENVCHHEDLEPRGPLVPQGSCYLAGRAGVRPGGRTVGGWAARRADGRANSDPTGVHPPTHPRLLSPCWREKRIVQPGGASGRDVMRRDHQQTKSDNDPSSRPQQLCFGFSGDLLWNWKSALQASLFDPLHNSP